MKIDIKKIRIMNGPQPDLVYDFDNQKTQELLSVMFRIGFYPKVMLVEVVIPNELAEILDSK